MSEVEDLPSAMLDSSNEHPPLLASVEGAAGDQLETDAQPSSWTYGADAVAAASRAALRDAVAQGSNLALSEKLRGTYVAGQRDRQFDDLLAHSLATVAAERSDGRPFEGRGIVVVADSGAGKTELVRRGLLRHHLFAEGGINKPGCRVLSVTCVGSCTLRVVGELLLHASGYPVRSILRENEIWQIARERLKMLGIVAVHIDELNNLLQNLNQDERQRSLNNLKALLNNSQWPVALILSGTPSVVAVIRADDQIRRRLMWLYLRPLQFPHDGQTLEMLVAKLCQKANLNPAGLPGDVIPRLIHAARGQLGTAAEICVQAVERAAKEESGTLERQHFADAYTERTGGPATENPFLRHDWTATDPRAVLNLTVTPNETASGGRKTRSRSRRRGFA